MKKVKLSFLFFLTYVSISINGQPVVADKIVAVVGKSSILYSEIEEQYMQMKAYGQKPDRCSLFEDLLAQKLLITQAEIDSIEVTDSEVELELEQRLLYFINQFGTEQKLVEYYGKSVLEIKDDMRDAVREQNLTRKMQAEIVKEILITPAEVKAYYKQLDSDSIPIIESQLQVAQIVIYPESDEESVFEVKEKLIKLRERILNGESFTTMAVLYSEGPSASQGGDIGWTSKSDLDPAYAKAAFALKKGHVSKIVESSFGYHLIEVLDKSDDRIKTRHILMKPKISIEAKQKAKGKLDTITQKIRLDSITFEKAAMYFSQDENTRLNGGLKVNPSTLSTKFNVDEFSTSEYFIIRKLKVGDMSAPFESTDEKGKTVMKIVQLKSKTEPHKANLKDDFDLLKNAATQAKQAEVLNSWIAEKSKNNYIRIEPPYDKCDFRIANWIK